MLTQKNNNDELKDLFYNLLNSYRIEIKIKYQFVYDDFFEHLLKDTDDEITKKLSNNTDFDLTYFKQLKFKDNFYKHYSHSQWFYRILEPEDNIEVNRELRIRKIKQIENGSK